MMKSFLKFANQAGCRRCAALLTPYKEGTLGPRERDRVAAHLGLCAACRDEAVIMASVSDLLRAHPPTALAPAHDLWSRLEARIAAEEHKSSVPAVTPVFQRNRLQSPSLWQLSAGGAVAAAVVVAAFVRLSPLETVSPQNTGNVSISSPVVSASLKPQSLVAAAYRVPEAMIARTITPAPKLEAVTETRVKPESSRHFRWVVSGFKATARQRPVIVFAALVPHSAARQPDVPGSASFAEMKKALAAIDAIQSGNVALSKNANAAKPLFDNDFMVPVATDGDTTFYAPIHSAEVAKLAVKADAKSSPEAAVIEDTSGREAGEPDNLSQMTESLRRQAGLFSYQAH